MNGPGSDFPGVAQAKKSAVPPPTEDTMATMFVARYASELRYCHDRGAWFQWDGARWRPERKQLAFHYAREIARQCNPADMVSAAKAGTARGVERFAQADPRLSAVAEDWDADGWLFATPGGTVDLRSGKLRAARQDDLITKCAAVAPARMPTPIWDRFLLEAAGGDMELVKFMQRMSGYALTGDISEHALFFCYGDGGNGKGVYLNTISRIMGDYAKAANLELFNDSKHDRHPTELAALAGARLVTMQETQEGRAWDEVRIKALTGGDTVKARFMQRDFFEFAPTFKFIIAGNHKPNLRSVDNAIRRRLNILPFVNKPTQPDPDLPEKLKPEWPGILAALIEGCVEWQRSGLQQPPIVLSTTETYFEAQDTFTQWVEECCEQQTSKSDTTAALFASWKGWAERNGELPGNSKTFGEAMQKRGYQAVKNTPGHHGKRGYLGLQVAAKDTSKQWQNRDSE